MPRSKSSVRKKIAMTDLGKALEKDKKLLGAIAYVYWQCDAAACESRPVLKKEMKKHGIDIDDVERWPG